MWRTFLVRRTTDERIFLAVFFLYIKKYATWCPLSQQTIVPTLTVGLTFNDCRVSSVSSSSSRQSQTSAGGTACSRLPWPAVMPRKPHRPLLLPPLARPSLYSPTPPVILRQQQPHAAAEPVNPRTLHRVGIHCRVFPSSMSFPS